jgi:hypothetical protein
MKSVVQLIRTTSKNEANEGANETFSLGVPTPVYLGLAYQLRKSGDFGTPAKWPDWQASAGLPKYWSPQRPGVSMEAVPQRDLTLLSCRPPPWR